MKEQNKHRSSTTHHNWIRYLGRKPLQANTLSHNVGYLNYLSNKQNNTLAAQAYLYEKGKLGQRITINNPTSLQYLKRTNVNSQKLHEPDIRREMENKIKCIFKSRHIQSI